MLIFLTIINLFCRPCKPTTWFPAPPALSMKCKLYYSFFSNFPCNYHKLTQTYTLNHSIS